ncbi:collagen binding domain-containing protein [Streptococcus suis]|uniref:collagen binding domain-containing protein n=2 Tax=Streptococcus suis TaxID=1307 RepID=UPI0037D50BA4
MRIIKQLVCCIIALVCSLSLPSLLVQAEDTYSIQVGIPLPEQMDASKMELQLEAWYLSEEERETPEQMAEKLFPLNRDELTQLYGQTHLSEKLTPQEVVGFSGLKKGWYYIRQFGQATTIEVIPFVLQVDGRLQTIQAKVGLPGEKVGYRNFLKVSTSTAPLAGAVFQVLEEVDGQLRQVMIDGKPYHLTSENGGHLKVGPLPYGSYYLKEVKAPAGYILAQDTIPFEITSDSHVSEIVKIKNKPVTPPGIEIPYTGNAVVIAVLSLGIILFLLGYRLVTYKKGEKT